MTTPQYKILSEKGCLTPLDTKEGNQQQLMEYMYNSTTIRRLMQEYTCINVLVNHNNTKPLQYLIKEKPH